MKFSYASAIPFKQSTLESMDVEIRKLAPTDLTGFQDLIQVFEVVFEMQPFALVDAPYLQQLLASDSFYVFVAVTEGNVVGGLTAYRLQQYYSKLPLVYVYDLAILPHYQQQGVGKGLMASLTTFSKEMGAEEVFVQADAGDTHAIEFYHATGGIAEKVVHFTYPLLST